MPFDVELAQRIRDVLASEPLVEERKMFGGLAFLIRGHMTLAASSKGGLMIRADPATTADVVASTNAEYVAMRGRQMRGWLHFDAADIESERELTSWINLAVAHSKPNQKATDPSTAAPNKARKRPRRK